ncbi:MAG: endolytic transglycosylase MltG, partial [Thermocrispum sp.]
GYGDHPVGALLDEDPPPARRSPAPRRGRPRKKKRRSAGRRLAGWLLAIALVGGLAAGAWFGAKKLLGFGYEDYQGSGKGDVIVQVVDGDSTAAIAERLAEAGVVASGDAFVDAAESNDDIRSIRPGYYQVKKQMSGAAAVQAIVGKDARVGELQIRSGTQLDDLKDPNGKKIPGIYTKLAQATCAKVDGKSTCVSPRTLRSTAEKTDLTKLGAPRWMVLGAAEAPKERRLEGMVLPGVYDIKPGWDAERVLTEVLTASAAQFEAAGLPDAAKATKRSAYETVVIASIIEREAVENDFAKVSRVVYNRLAEDMRLEMDSTINYVLDRPHIRTTSEDRAKPGPYNSYRNKTLPPSPISSPSAAALAAAVKPERGSWLYFVKCEKNGLSCFATDFDEHQTNVADAKKRGVW